MNFSDKELKQIEQMAALFLTVTDMATVLGVQPHELRAELRSSNAPAAKAYQKGKVATKVALRKQEMMLARVGSPLGLETTRAALADMEDDE